MCDYQDPSSNKACKNGAYYLFLDHRRCGVHSRLSKLKETTSCIVCKKASIGKYQGNSYCDSCSARSKLPKDKAKDEEILKAHERRVEEVAKINQSEGRRGEVIVTKMRMMKKIEHVDGYLSVFPNYLHKNRKDGLGVPSLSPKSLGPVHHPQPGLPSALNLENFHQYNKVFPDELNPDGSIKEAFFELQKKAYLDPIPHRHKIVSEETKDERRPNVPAFSVWISDGEIKRLTYFESRQFYCTYYERLTKELPEFKLLVNKLKEGYNLNIIGYDGYSVEQLKGESHAQSLERCYVDISRPFGHELVLYTLLTEEPEGYPWRKYTTEIF